MNGWIMALEKVKGSKNKVIEVIKAFSGKTYFPHMLENFIEDTKQ